MLKTLFKHLLSLAVLAAILFSGYGQLSAHTYKTSVPTVSNQHTLGGNPVHIIELGDTYRPHPRDTERHHHHTEEILCEKVEEEEDDKIHALKKHVEISHFLLDYSDSHYRWILSFSIDASLLLGQTLSCATSCRHILFQVFRI
ncbi:hypothetical protein BFP72_06380 [Reichenbachiella sp. 5M10]|uniref:hypothetical protein n=1 Tax=Reichenbachiella sp. 5M10 TaxID=1889772 RepID=UPI000C159ACB|nr:hypothetical protein [Reichenbachiella sp. 5M10]PIB35048.1 hypothetical protein BFP72_06380 [Reichenbachiella sp. 5M10]